MEFDKLTTEQVNTESLNLDLLTPYEAAQLMNRIDHQAVEAVNAALPAIGEAVEKIAVRLRRGGRLGVLDASECPPTFGVDKGLVIGLIAGGDSALRNASEDAEDKPELGRQALEDVGLREADAVVGISASGYAPYCVGGMDYARSCGALVIALTCNRNAIISGHADIAIEMPTGPEILSGSTRLKAGTATKLALNMLSTLTMVQLGKVYRNLMVDMQPANDKLRDRSVRIVQKALNGMEREQAERLYAQAGNSIQTAIVMGETGADAEAARQALNACDGIIRRAVDGLKK